MPPAHPPHSPELKHQIVEPVRADHSPAQLAREFELLLSGLSTAAHLSKKLDGQQTPPNR